MLKIDVDDVHRRSRFELQRIMYSLPRPFFVRVSSSGKGFHLVVPALGEWDWQRYAYDDQMRIDLDAQRERHRLPVRNLLWDIKNGNPARQWQIIRTGLDIEKCIDNKPQTICANTHNINMPQMGRRNRDWNKHNHAKTPERGIHRNHPREHRGPRCRWNQTVNVEYPGETGVPQMEDLT